MNKVTQVKDAIKLIESAETATGWVGSTDVSNLDVSTTHKQGATAITFDKDGTSEAFGQISKTLTEARKVDLYEHLGDDIVLYLNVSSLTNIASVSLYIGTDATDNNQYTTSDTDLSTGWNKLQYELESPSTVNGAGANLNDIRYIAVRVTLNTAANTLTSILVDSIRVGAVGQTDIQLAGEAVSTSNPLPVLQRDLNANNDTVGAVKAYSSASALAQTFYRSSALEASGVIKNASGNLYGGRVRLDSTAPSGTYYILTMNAPSLPGNGAVTMIAAPIKVIHTIGVDSLITDITDGEVVHGSSGIVIALSSTEFTLTISGAYLSINAAKA